MTSNFVDEQKKDLENPLSNQKKGFSEKKSLTNVLASFLESRQIDEKSKEKIKKEFSDIKNNMNETKTSFELLMDIQKKLVDAYNNLTQKEDEIKKTKNN